MKTLPSYIVFGMSAPFPFQEMYTDRQPHLGMIPVFSEKSCLAAYGARCICLSLYVSYCAMRLCLFLNEL